MIASFAGKATEDIFNGDNTTAARKLLPRQLWNTAFRKLDQVDSAVSLDDLRIPPGNRLEALKGERSGQYSIRINDQYRICFEWDQNNAANVEIVDYH
ncbi:MAG: type II toxin-antitoxin system RelE/ParE family toxin [Acidobacteria bacterium]|nr:type II toxin-antitoxin system RelE/ParE family toxin [Acidobacteriota bacterium]